jgi:hypothetical protein
MNRRALLGAALTLAAGLSVTYLGEDAIAVLRGVRGE